MNQNTPEDLIAVSTFSMNKEGKTGDELRRAFTEELMERLSGEEISDLIFCDVIVRKPLLCPVPELLPWAEILENSPALVRRDPSLESAYRSLDGSILIDVSKGHRIYVEVQTRGGRKARRSGKRRMLRLIELLLMDTYGFNCRVRFTAKERVFIAQFGK